MEVKYVVLAFFLGIILSPSLAVPTCPVGYDSNIIISATETTGLARTNETISLDFSTVAGWIRSKIRTDCNDIRVYDYVSDVEKAFTNTTCDASNVKIEFAISISASTSSNVALICYNNPTANAPTVASSLLSSKTYGNGLQAGWDITFGAFISRLRDNPRTEPLAYVQPSNPFWANATGTYFVHTIECGDGVTECLLGQYGTGGEVSVTNQTIYGLYSNTFSIQGTAGTLYTNITYYDTGSMLLNVTAIGTVGTDYRVAGTGGTPVQYSAIQANFMNCAGAFRYHTSVASETCTSGLMYHGWYNTTSMNYVAFILQSNNTVVGGKQEELTTPDRWYLYAFGNGVANPSWIFKIVGGVARSSTELQAILDNEYIKARNPLNIVSTEVPVINSIFTNPSVPFFGYTNIQTIVNATDDNGVTSLSMNWTWPNSTKSNIDNLTLAVPGTGNWTSTNFSIDQFGIYTITITACDISAVCVSNQSTFAITMNHSINTQNPSGDINLPTNVGQPVTIRFNYTSDYNFTPITSANTNVTIFDTTASRTVLSTGNAMTYLSSIGLWQFNYTTPTGTNGTYKYNIKANVTSTTYGSYVDINGTFDTNDTTAPTITGTSLSTKCLNDATKKYVGDPITVSITATDNWAVNWSASYCMLFRPDLVNMTASVDVDSHSCTFATVGAAIGTLNSTVFIFDNANLSSLKTDLLTLVSTCPAEAGTGTTTGGGGGGGGATPSQLDILALLRNVTCTNPKECVKDSDCCNTFACSVNATIPVGKCYKTAPISPTAKAGLIMYCEKDDECASGMVCRNRECAFVPASQSFGLIIMVVFAALLMTIGVKGGPKSR